MRSSSAIAAAGQRRVWGGFDFSRFEPFNGQVNNTVQDFDLFTVGTHLSGAEITRLHVSGEPRGIWYPHVSWLPIVSRGSVQEILTASSEPVISQAGTPIANPTQTGSANSAGIRWVSYGSLSDPMPVSIALAPGATFGIRILSVNGKTGNAFMVYVRAIGFFFRR